MTSKQITSVLMRRWVGGRVALPNYMGRGSNGESDLFLVTSSHYCEEVEIKVSVADFKREFKVKKFKHGCLNSDPEYDYVRTNSAYLLPRRYWFACPASIAEHIKKEIAGTLYGLLVIEDDRVREAVKPKTISGARKLTAAELFALAKCMTYRISNHWIASLAES